jgi:hypothetical protein
VRMRHGWCVCQIMLAHAQVAANSTCAPAAPRTGTAALIHMWVRPRATQNAQTSSRRRGPWSHASCVRGSASRGSRSGCYERAARRRVVTNGLRRAHLLVACSPTRGVLGAPPSACNQPGVSGCCGGFGARSAGSVRFAMHIAYCIHALRRAIRYTTAAVKVCQAGQGCQHALCTATPAERRCAHCLSWHCWASAVSLLAGGGRSQPGWTAQPRPMRRDSTQRAGRGLAHTLLSWHV